MVTQNRLKELFSYNPNTGLFKWRINKPPRGRVGEIAGCNAGHGYIKISIDGKRYYAHRLVFLYMTGMIPKEIDHINHCRHDNRWNNLRPTTRKINLANVSGRSGVRFRYGHWYARYADKHIGIFDTKKDALAARKTFEIARAGVDPNIKHDIPENAVKAKSVRRYKFRGKTLSEWSRETGIPQGTIWNRIFRQGWPPELAVSRPATPRHLRRMCLTV